MLHKPSAIPHDRANHSVFHGSELVQTPQPTLKYEPPAELALEKQATTLLLPISVLWQLFELPDELAAKIPVLHRTVRDALMKSLLMRAAN